MAERFMEKGSKTALSQFVTSRCQEKEIDGIELRKKINLFALKFKRLWKESNRKRERFFNRNKAWLSKFETFSELQQPKGKRGRPRKSAESLFNKNNDNNK